ncbi:MAG: OmpH family outer membrane protein [Parachlamydiales bacterium]
MKKLALGALCALFPITAAHADLSSTMPKVQMIGILDFQQCVDNSKEGKEQGEQLKSIEAQLSSTIQETEKGLQEIIQKAQDPDYRDSLSPEAEREMLQRGQMLHGQLQEQRQQFYQIMQQAEMQVIQQLRVGVARAAGVVAKKYNLDLVLPENATFYFKSGMDITKDVITELDKQFDQDKKQKEKK